MAKMDHDSFECNSAAERPTFTQFFRVYYNLIENFYFSHAHWRLKVFSFYYFQCYFQWTRCVPFHIWNFKLTQKFILSFIWQIIKMFKMNKVIILHGNWVEIDVHLHSNWPIHQMKEGFESPTLDLLWLWLTQKYKSHPTLTQLKIFKKWKYFLRQDKQRSLINEWKKRENLYTPLPSQCSDFLFFNIWKRDEKNKFDVIKNYDQRTTFPEDCCAQKNISFADFI